MVEMLVHKQGSALRENQASLGSNNQATLSVFSSPSYSSWVPLRSVLFIISSSSSSSSLPVSDDRGSPKSPWPGRRSKHSLMAKQWKELFDADGRFSDDGAKFLKKIRRGGIEPSLRSEAWPFLLGMYDVKSSEKERRAIRDQKRKEYLVLWRQCRQISGCNYGTPKPKEMHIGKGIDYNGDDCQLLDPLNLDMVSNARHSAPIDTASLSGELIYKYERNANIESSKEPMEQRGISGAIYGDNVSEAETESLDSDSSDDEKSHSGSAIRTKENHHYEPFEATPPEKLEAHYALCRPADFVTWQKIICLDAIRMDTEWLIHSPSQASISLEKAELLAESVGLKDYDHLEPSSIYHAARLVSILEAYALYDPEIGYCQGMSELLSPIISVIEEDDIAFWCFVGFMRKARHNFRLDEIGIKRQLSIVSKIIKCKDTRLYKHLQKLQAEDCFFVYRMVVVLFRRELSFEQTLCLWEVMWANQAAIRAGVVKSWWRSMRMRAPPTEDLLLYAIAACVLQKRKMIMDNDCSMDEIMKECNDMAGNLDVWKLLDDAHDLVVALDGKI